MSAKGRTRLVVGVLVALAVVAVAAIFIVPRLRPAAPIRVGVLLPLSGADGAEGLAMRNAVRLAADEINQKGGVQGRKVELVEIDDGSQVDKALEGVQRLVGDPAVLAAVAGFDGDVYSGIQLQLRDGGLGTAIAGVSNWDKMRLRGNTEFRIIPFGSMVEKHAAQHAFSTLGARSYAFFTDDSYFGVTTVNHFRDGVRPLAGDIAAEVVVRRGETEFKEPVELLKARPVDYVIYTGRSQEAALFLAKLRAAGIKSHFQAGIHHPSQEFLDVAKDSAEGAFAAFHGLPTEDLPGGKAFLAAYAERRYPEPPGVYGVWAYASAQTVMQALSKSFLTRPSVIGALTNENFETALGPVKYNYFGSNHQTAALYQVKGGKWVPIFVTGKTGQLQPYAPAR